MSKKIPIAYVRKCHQRVLDKADDLSFACGVVPVCTTDDTLARAIEIANSRRDEFFKELNDFTALTSVIIPLKGHTVVDKNGNKHYYYKCLEPKGAGDID